MDDWICSCEACMGTLSPPEPDEDELERWIIWRDIYNVVAIIEATDD